MASGTGGTGSTEPGGGLGDPGNGLGGGGIVIGGSTGTGTGNTNSGTVLRPKGADSGCACDVVGRSPAGSVALLLSGLGLAVATARRRRKAA
jgi:MYXO-CTERM domain-containing protein